MAGELPGGLEQRGAGAGDRRDISRGRCQESGTKDGAARWKIRPGSTLSTASRRLADRAGRRARTRCRPRDADEASVCSPGPNKAGDLTALVEQQFGQVRAVLAGNR